MAAILTIKSSIINIEKSINSVDEFSTYKNWQKQAEILENNFVLTKTISVVRALKLGFRSLTTLKLVVNVVGEL